MRAFADLFDPRHHKDLNGIAVIVDLLGPESVAFAAGCAGTLDPVILFDNWPHPRGVVLSHLTLAACAYYQPLFAKARAALLAAKTSAPPIFLLDRARLTSYSDDSKQFDNRYVARVPSVSQLSKLGISRTLYVTPTDADLELDDLNDDFVYTARQGAQLRAVAATSFASHAAATPTLGIPQNTSLQNAMLAAVTADAGATQAVQPVLRRRTTFLRRRSDDARMVLARLSVDGALRREGRNAAARTFVHALGEKLCSAAARHGVLERRARWNAHAAAPADVRHGARRRRGRDRRDFGREDEPLGIVDANVIVGRRLTWSTRSSRWSFASVSIPRSSRRCASTCARIPSRSGFTKMGRVSKSRKRISSRTCISSSAAAGIITTTISARSTITKCGSTA